MGFVMLAGTLFPVATHARRYVAKPASTNGSARARALGTVAADHDGYSWERSRRYVHDTYIIIGGSMSQPDPLKELHEALLQIVGVLNRPQGDNVILTRAGVSLDTALFPLLVRVSMQRNLTIGELADQVGRDYSTVSRQVGRLQALGLVHSELSQADRRRRLLGVTAAGKNTIKKIDRARSSVMSEALDGWSRDEIAELARMTTRLAAAMRPRA